MSSKGPSLDRRFFEELRRNTSYEIEFRTIPKTHRPVFSRFERDLDNLATLTQQSIDEQGNLYFGVATREGKGGTKKHCREVPALWSDIDFKNLPREVAERRIGRFSCPPSAVIESGNGLHLYWFLAEPMNAQDDQQLIESSVLALAEAFGADQAVCDVARIMRVPGTLNFKSDPATSCKVITLEPDALYHPIELNAALEDAKWRIERNLGTSEGFRDRQLTRLAGSKFSRGASVPEVVKMALEWNELNNPPMEGRKVRQTVTSIKRCDERNHPAIDPKSGYGYTFSELMEAEVNRPEPIVEGLYYQGHTAIFAGAFGQGKTFKALQLSMSLATGRNFLGRKVARPYRVLFLDTENGQGEIKARLGAWAEQQQLSDDDRELLNQNWKLVDYEEPGPLNLLNLSREDDFRRLGSYIRENQPEVIIIDCLGKVYPNDEQKEQGVKKLVGNLQKLVREHECLQKGLILFLHHVTKFSTEKAEYSLLNHPYEFLSRVRGTGRLLDLMQERLALEQVNDGGEPYYVINGVIRSGTVSPLILQRDENGFFLLHEDKNLVLRTAFVGCPARKVLFERIEAKLPDRFRFTDVLGLEDSSGKTFSRQTVTDTLKVACANGLLEQPADKMYGKINLDCKHTTHFTESPSPLNLSPN